MQWNPPITTLIGVPINVLATVSTMLRMPLWEHPVKNHELTFVFDHHDNFVSEIIQVEDLVSFQKQMIVSSRFGVAAIDVGDEKNVRKYLGGFADGLKPIWKVCR